MKKFQVYFFSVALLFACFSCDKDDGLSEEERTIILLCKKWAFARVVLGEEDITAFGYEQSEITFLNDGTWVAANGGDLFGNSGTWSFANNSFNSIIVSGTTMEMDLHSQGANLELRFSFTATTPLSGRSQSLDGNYAIFLLPYYPN